jgi:hypothetical protein
MNVVYVIVIILIMIIVRLQEQDDAPALSDNDGRATRVEAMKKTATDNYTSIRQ